ncbi:sensor histidine kinase [Nocardioides sp. STR2]|uniref:histidine kinase n=1 Tax=Nocardioides pini TaxID=2975053 RepID=A0ABT4C8H7_9ACTN|nr:sensor histidine kinase [Nocardioides pini]MCY4725256.1 sensor histidine kinase [Nocardioides pini]
MLDRAWALPARLPRRDLADLALAMGVAVVAVAETATGEFSDAPIGRSLLSDLLFTLPLVLRRRRPLATFLLILVGIDLQVLLVGTLDGVGLLASLLVASYSLGAHAPLGRALTGLAAFLPAIMYASWLDVGDPADDLGFISILVGGSWLAGRVVWSRNRLVEQVAEQARELRRSRDAEARAREAEHRARVGRDVHDVVAHSVTLMVVQAEAGEALLAPDHPSAENLRAIQRVGRRTLTELRDVLGRLGEADEPRPAATTTPGLGDARRLAAELTEAGLDLELSIDRDLVPLPADLELVAYRILQEALTNALRHSPGAHVDASVRVTGDGIVVEVTDVGGRTAAGYAEGGHGLTGMRERARAQGGVVTAGPDDGGFTVRARLPLTVPAAAAEETTA